MINIKKPLGLVTTHDRWNYNNINFLDKNDKNQLKIGISIQVSDKLRDFNLMDGRRLRRFGRRRRRQSSLLPVGATAPDDNAAYTVSCCYCDFKIRALNDALSRFGRRHAAWLRVWFSIGVGFSLTLLLALSFLLVWNLFAQRNSNDAAFFFLFGFSPSVGTINWISSRVSIRCIIKLIIHGGQTCGFNNNTSYDAATSGCKGWFFIV